MIAEDCGRVVKTTVSPFRGIAKTSFLRKDTYDRVPTSWPTLARSSFKTGELFVLW
jgi:hypothetical protein